MRKSAFRNNFEGVQEGTRYKTVLSWRSGGIIGCDMPLYFQHTFYVGKIKQDSGWVQVHSAV